MRAKAKKTTKKHRRIVSTEHICTYRVHRGQLWTRFVVWGPLRCTLLQTRFPDGDPVSRQKHSPAHPRSEGRGNDCPFRELVLSLSEKGIVDSFLGRLVSGAALLMATLRIGFVHLRL